MNPLSKPSTDETREKLLDVADDMAGNLKEALYQVQTAQKHLNKESAAFSALRDVELHLKDLHAAAWNLSRKRS